MPQKPTDDKLGWGQMLICINYTDFFNFQFYLIRIFVIHVFEKYFSNRISQLP